MNIELLKLLSENARTSEKDLAVMLGKTEEEIKNEIKLLEKQGVIAGYKAVVNWDMIDGSLVSAVVELKVIPKAGFGFEEIAEKITNYEQVESVYLMSGGFDLNVVVKGKTLQDVARFVARELATMESVTSTATHFVMCRYKEMDTSLFNANKYGRGQLFI